MKAALGLCVLLVACATAQERTPSTAFSVARASSVKVDAINGDESDGGSATAITSKCFLTADHVVHGMKTIVVMRPGEESIGVTIVKENTEDDLAIICAEKDTPIPPIKLGPDPKVDDPVFIIGNPLSHTAVLTEGRYEDIDLITAPAAPGNSGGGAFNSKGELIGVVDSIHIYASSAGSLTFAHLCNIVGLTAIKEFIKGL